MMKMLVPVFLKRLDKYLLLHQPEIWVSRIHYITFYCLLSSIAVFSFTYLLEVSKSNVPTYELSFLLLFLPLAVVFVIWVISVIRHNPVRDFSKTTLFGEYKTLICFYFSVLIIFIIPFGSLIGGKLKVNNLVTYEEYQSDSLVYRKMDFVLHYNIHEVMGVGDKYQLVTNYYSYGSGEVSADTNYITTNKGLLIRYLREFRAVYDQYKGESLNYNYDHQTDEELYNGIFIAKDIKGINRQGITNKLNDIKNYLKIDFLSYYEALLLLSALICLLLYVFKNSRNVDFFFAIIALIVLLEFVAFFLVSIRSNFGFSSNHYGLVLSVVIIVLLYLLYFIMVYRGLQKESYSRLLGVSSIVLHLFLCVLPIMILGCYDSVIGVYIKEEVYFIMEVLTMLIMLVLTPLVFKPMYQKVYAFPRH